MKKRFISVMLLFLIVLSGCQAKDTTVDFSALLNDFFNQTPPTTTNHVKYYYSYYLPPSVGRMESTETSNTFLISSQEVIMNLDIASIIQSSYYPTETPASGSTFVSGLYTDAEGQTNTYTMSSFPLENNNTLIELSNGQVTFLTIVNPGNARYLLNEIVIIFRSFRTNTDSVLSDFSIKNSLVYDKKHQDIFEQVPPENSSIMDMMCTLTGSAKYCTVDGSGNPTEN